MKLRAVRETLPRFSTECYLLTLKPCSKGFVHEIDLESSAERGFSVNNELLVENLVKIFLLLKFL